MGAGRNQAKENDNSSVIKETALQALQLGEKATADSTKKGWEGTSPRCMNELALQKILLVLALKRMGTETGQSRGVGEGRTQLYLF